MAHYRFPDTGWKSRDRAQLNPTKFQFAQKEVDFAGFNISETKVQPLPKYLDAIAMFPTPKNTTDIRSWFGLVNQLSTYAQLRDIMSPFRPFLSPKVKFMWTSKLNEAFEASKKSKIESIRDGVEIFDTKRPTCLRPDWSKQGIGYFLLQKHCKCTAELPNCCADGWKVTLAGSRFLSDQESRYAAVEGEALAIAWGLEHSRYFTQGCDQLLVVTDHKPLLKTFGDRTLDEITNTRLFRIKQRTLPWFFKIAYMPGKTNAAADAASRHPCPSYAVCHMSSEDLGEHLTMNAISKEATDLTAISWSTIASETRCDPVLSELEKAIQENFEGTYHNISSYLRYKDSLFTQNGVVIYQDRVVIPKSLRSSVLDSLHAAHQGTSAMQMRAQSIVFWPGITGDIESKRRSCSDCNRNAPSQAVLPTEPATPPSTPFEHIFADFFYFGGHHYLVAGDRLSGFAEVFHTPSGTSSAGAAGLLKCLRKWFGTFGVPKELSSDGGPEFTASTTSEFLRKWGVVHRQSSAYHPKSNGRAEVAVKVVKRLLRSNTGPCGTVNTDKFLRAVLQLRNTPDPDCGISPAEIVFGNRLHDNFLFAQYADRSQYREGWRRAWAAKEEALRARFVRTAEKINAHARQLPPLKRGDKCFVQNQTGNSPKKWDCSGTVMDVLPHDKYAVQLDGSRYVTNRNRQYLRRYEPARLTMTPSPRPLVLGSDIDAQGSRKAERDSVRDDSGNLDEDNCHTHTQKSSRLQQNDIPIIPTHDMPDANEGEHRERYGEPSREQPLSPSPLRDRRSLAKTRLRAYNSPGLKETTACSTRLRPRP